jgi:EAL domain-containing protein (putative c-di-GMP-specific phosphodiesterase class I)
LDIDKFGIYNELYGNKIGDEILKYVAKLLVDNFDKDSVYRIGSDNFAIFIQNNNLKIIDKLDSIFRKIKIKVNDIYIENLTFKAGISSIPNYLDNAFIALNIAKKENKHCHIFSQDDLQKEKEKIEYALYWTQKIENAIRNDLIVPVFQKIVDKNGNLFKYEMLLRVKDKDKLIPPFFLDIALQNNQYFDISKIMFKKAIEYINTKKISLSFNIFYLDIQNKNMYSFFKEEIKKCLYLELLTFEILESADIKDYELLNNKLEFFRNLGCKLAIDDFGSGYSNYRHILELKPNFLKIDGSLVKDILEDKNSLYIVESLQSLAKKTNIKTIAEFVENEEIFNKLKEIGIDYYQGYYFSKPSLL